MSIATLLIREPLGARHGTIPLHLGGASADVVLPEARDSMWIDHDGSQWWLRPAPDAAVLVNGVMHREPLVLHDGDVLQAGAAQLIFAAGVPALDVLHLAGNATVAPLQDERLPGEAINPGAAEIHVAGEIDPAPAAALRRRSRRAVTWWIALPLALLVTAAVVLFRLVNVPLEISPGTAVVQVPGWFNWRSGDRLFLLPGNHQLHVQAQGYAARNVGIDAATVAASQMPLRIELALLPDTLEVDTQGVAGELLLDGKPAGSVPGAVQVLPGSHEISIRAPRHVEYTAKVEVKGGGHRQPVRVQLLSSYGWLVLATAPTGARVRIDDEDKGPAPLRLELEAGLRHLSIVAPGRRGWSSQVAILAGQTLDLGIVDLSLPAPRVVEATTAIDSDAAGASAAQPAPTAPAAPPPPPSRVQSALLGTLLLLPAGSFPEGSDRREQGRRSNEVLRQVTLTRPFYLAEREVSNAQYRAFRAEHSSGLAMEKSLDLDNQAVTNISWSDAVEFCNWLSLREGLPAAYERREGRWQLLQPRNSGYRLPTEAEWEYAARYVDGQHWRRYAWGDNLPPPAGAANLGGQESLPAKPGPEQRLATALPGYSDEHAVVAPIGSYARSAVGLLDLGGNVSEWTHDVYASMPEAAAVTDPLGPEADGPHAVRGANWRTAAIAELRLAWRDRATGPSQTVGFRVARNVETP
ncbi:MAG TPA: SUMF1/EgtB/PvdO family nonheme iron enzyme [Steroidobacteraceae bacterium]|nr:SUMF1/EgtB/PvdO family nonheme iron enzyme [Steroidobacteraceae bacterium]